MNKNTKVNKKEFWEERYLSKRMPWDISQVAPAFVKCLTKNTDLITRNGKVAVLGCGLGHDAFYFANNKEYDFEVYGFDFAESAIKYCNEIKQKENLTNIDFYQVDFFELTKDKKWENHFNCIIEHTSLAAIDPNRRKEYIDLIKYLLKPGGELIGLFFIRPKELGGPPFGITPEEVRELFKEDFKEVEELHPEPCLHTNLKGEEYFGVFRKR